MDLKNTSSGPFRLKLNVILTLFLLHSNDCVAYYFKDAVRVISVYDRKIQIRKVE